MIVSSMKITMLEHTVENYKLQLCGRKCNRGNSAMKVAVWRNGVEEGRVLSRK
jgi:hypothetical protein